MTHLGVADAQDEVAGSVAVCEAVLGLDQTCVELQDVPQHVLHRRNSLSSGAWSTLKGNIALLMDVKGTFSLRLLFVKFT